MISFSWSFRLERADWVDFANNHSSTLASQCFGGTLAHVSVTGHEANLSTDQNIGGSVDAVWQRVADSVLVIELALGNRVVHIDSWEKQFTILEEIIKAVHSSGGFLGYAQDLTSNGGESIWR